MGVSASVASGGAATTAVPAVRVGARDKAQRSSSTTGLFVDEEFPPDDSSLYFDKSKATWPADITWKRACECPDLPQKVTDGEVGPSDILQGALGDCYFLCALSVLAERPDRVLRLLPSTAVSVEGRYMVRLYKDGVPRDMVVDDYLPCVQQGDGKFRPVFSRSKTGELWPLLLEKAYAKAHGSYQQIESGAGHHALEDLTGMPSTVLNLKEMNPDTAFTEIEEADKRNYVMTASTRAGDKEAEALGFVSSHQYGVLTAKSHGALRLVQIRNPWGSTEWKGDWSDKSALWTAELKAHFGWTDVDDGTFWMDTKDFIKHFETLAVLVYEEGWETRAVQLQGGDEVVELRVGENNTPQGGDNNSKQPITAWISAKLQDKRCFDPDSGYTYPKVRFQLVRTGHDADAAKEGEGGDRGVLHWSREAEEVRDLHEKVEARLTPGTTYHIIVTRQPAQAPVSVAVYCPSNSVVELKVCQLPSQEDGRCVLTRIYEAEALRSGKVVSQPEDYLKDYLHLLTSSDPPIIYRKELCFPWGMAVVLANNTSGGGSSCLEVSECSELALENMELVLASKGDSSTTTKVEPTEDGTGVKVTQKVGPGEVSAYVLFSSHLARSYSYSRRRIVLVRDVQANSPASLQALLTKAQEQGVRQDLHPPHVGSYSYDVPQGFALAVVNGGESGVVLKLEVTFEVEGMQVWALALDGASVAQHLPKEGGGGDKKAAVPSSVVLRPGEKQLLVLRATEEGEVGGFSFGYQFQYSMEPAAAT